MTITIVILAYVANVFLNRWLNFLIVKRGVDGSILPYSWFLSFICTIIYLLFMIGDLNLTKKFINWFKGKYW